MQFLELKKAVESNIEKLITIFNKDPAIFLTEADVQCYLYSLLVNDPFFKENIGLFKEQTPVKISQTLLVHAELEVGIRGKSKRYDISILKPGKNLDLADWETLIGIEIKYNRRQPARKENCGILKDIRSVRYNKQGYVLWLNWDRIIDDKHLEMAQKLVKKYENVKLYYLDIISDPIKTNVKEILE